MGESFQKRITALLLSNKRHTRYVAMVACMAVAVVFGVTVGLTQEGQAKTHEEKVLDCQYSGDAAHTHDASCYDADGNLVCALAEREYHVHDDSCYASETHVVCGMEEGEGAHTHDESCYDEEGNLVCGLEESAGHVHTDECYQTDTWLACGKEEVAEEHVHGEGCFKTIIVEDEPAAEPAKAEAAKAATAESGEQTFTGELKDADGNVVVSVAVKAPAGALPDGATMRVKAVDEAAIKDKVDEAVKAEAGDNASAKSITAVDIAFLDKDGNEVEPSQKVEVKITSAAVRDIDAPALVHIDEKAGTAEVVRDTAKVNADDKDTSTGNEDTLKFDTDQFSPYVIVETEELHGELLTGNGGVYDVVVTAGPEAGIPADAQLQVTELADTSDEYLSAFDEVVAQKKAQDENFDEDSLGMAAFDITIVDANGNPFEPLAPVNVTVNIAQLPADIVEDTAELQHLDTSTGETVVETVATVADETLAIDGETAVAEFELESFSTFTLTWNNDAESATIIFGTTEGGQFIEFDETKMSFDTTASSFSLANAHEGYLYTGAVYCKPGQTMDDGVDADSVLNKNSSGWELTTYKTGEDEQIETETVNVENGSTIYVTYTVPSSSPQPAPDDGTVPSPTLKKVVTDNGDGTYTIQLDVEGATVEEDKSHYANVLVILDATKSMNGSKWTNAKAAMKTLVETLTEGENATNAGKIDFALVTFGRSATVTQNWTKNNTAFKTTCANVNMVTTSGTNWEAGMRGGLYGVLNSMPDDDPTYVIFLTDGDPNVYYSSGSDTNYTNSGTTNGYNQNANTSANHSADEAKAIAANTKLYGIYCGDSGTTPSGESYNRLVNVITGSGQGGVKTIAANADTIESEFKAIAQTMIDEMGASNASVDDGIPALSSISSAVVGEASGFEYQISSDGTNYSDWATAPGASYSQDNGVTWDLSEVGTIKEGNYYRLRFTVWPSQDAYDLIADLNNGKKTMSEDELEEAGIANNAGVYTLKTNTHLNMNYTYKDESYSDPTDYTEGAMLLPAEKISLKKLWPENALDQYGEATYRDEDGNEKTADSIDLMVTRNGEDYLEVNVGKDNGWVKDDIYISCGMMTVKDGVVTIKEPGYDYTVTEPSSFSYYWDLIAPTYHPMVINGSAALLMLDETATSADNVNSFSINGKIYKKLAEGATLEASNYRRSNLNLTKVLDPESAPTDTWFTYSVTVTDADSTDGYVWFSAWDPTAGSTVKDTDWVVSGANAQAGDTGYWYANNGATVSFKIKAGWNVRFLNLKHNSTFSFTETGVGDGFTYEKAETKTQESIESAWSQVNNETKTVTGTIVEPNNSYTVTYTNKWTTEDFTINKVDNQNPGNPLTGATFTFTRGNEAVPGFEQEGGAKREELKNNATTSVPLGSAVYCLTETGAPAGYNILSDAIYIKVSPGANGLVASLVNSEGKDATYPNATVSSDGKTITVSNTPGTELPMTGGPGTTLFMITGTAIIAVAVTYGIASRRRRERGLD